MSTSELVLFRIHFLGLQKKSVCVCVCDFVIVGGKPLSMWEIKKMKL